MKDEYEAEVREGDVLCVHCLGRKQLWINLFFPNLILIAALFGRFHFLLIDEKGRSRS